MATTDTYVRHTCRDGSKNEFTQERWEQLPLAETVGGVQRRECNNCGEIIDPEEGSE